MSHSVEPYLPHTRETIESLTGGDDSFLRSFRKEHRAVLDEEPLSTVEVLTSRQFSPHLAAAAARASKRSKN